MIEDDEADTLTKTAYHECGHAVMAVLLGGRIDLLTLDPEEDERLPNRGGEIRVTWPPDTWTEKELAVFEIKVSLAGPIVEMIFDECRENLEMLEEWHYDWQLAFERVREFLPDHRPVTEYLGEFAYELMTFFERDDVWAVVAALADQLEAHETLEMEEIEDVMAAWPIDGFEI